VTEHQVSV